MFGSVILDVAVGLALVYLLLSLVSASLREWISGLLKTRSRTLNQGMCEILGDEKLVADFYDHPLILSLYRGASYDEAKKNRTLPSYIPAKNFSAVLFDLIVRGRDSASGIQAGPEARRLTVESVRAQITRIENVRVQRAVLSALDSSQGDLALAQANVEQWFDSTMDRVSGWYKQRTQVWVFLIGLVLVVIADADTLSIARRLYADPGKRQAAVAMAAPIARDSAGAAALADRAIGKLDSLSLPIVGWNEVPIAGAIPTWTEWKAIGRHTRGAFIGWLITALAISLGAPFWFDTLGRIMIVRSTVKPHQKSPEESSGDRQKPTTAGAAPLVVATAPHSHARPAVAMEGAQPLYAASAPPPPERHEWSSGHPDGGVI